MLLSTLTGLLTLWSCNNTLSENTEHDRVITFDLKTADCGVKSSIDLAEDKIVNINIFAFSDGIACGHLFTEESSRAKIILPSGEFTVYIAANLGKMKDFATEKELSEWRYRIDASSALAGTPLPYTAILNLNTNNLDRSEIPVTLTRMVAKCGFRFNASAIPGLTVKSVRLCQAALDIRPFTSDGSTPERIEEHGDYASAEDIYNLNAGGTVYFYALENHQGELLSGNDDPWNKIPDNIPGKAKSCTYIEVTGTFDQSTADGVYGNVKYRFFLGHNASSDFSLTRNTECVVEMTASQDGLSKISWLIDTSEMKTDPLNGLGSFIIPEYLGQWGRISIPGASATSPVSISDGNGTITIGEESSDPQKYISLNNGYILYYIPSVSTTDVFLYASPESSKGTGTKLYLRSEASSKELDIPAPSTPECRIRETGKLNDLYSATLNEDGYDAKAVDLVLTDNDGAAMSPDDFTIPDKRIAKELGWTTTECPDGDIYGSFRSDFISAIDITSSSYAGIKLDYPTSAQMKNSRKILSGMLYGALAGDTRLNISNRLGCAETAKVNCTVNAAFPGQRYLGELTNSQLSIHAKTAEEHRENHILDLYQGKAGTTHAEWSFVRTSPSFSTTQAKTAYANPETGCSSMSIDGVTNGKMSINFLAPERNFTVNKVPFFTCGAFCFRGTVTNPYTNKTHEGYWMQDIILEFTVTAQVDFMPGYVCFSYVPYNICFASPKYSEIWQKSLPLLVKPDNLVNDYQIYGEESQDQTFITGNKPLGLVPFKEWEKYSFREKEYRVLTLVPSGFDENNRYPFCEERENELTGLLWDNLSMGTGKTGINISQRTVSSFIPLNKDGSQMPAERSIVITRSNAKKYPAFKGFFRITRDYGQYQTSLLANIGRYVIEASPIAQEYQTPFYSDIL